MEVKLENSEAHDTRDSDSDVHPTEKRKTTKGLLEELVLSAKSDRKGEQSQRPATRAATMEIKARYRGRGHDTGLSQDSVPRHVLRQGSCLATGYRAQSPRILGLWR